MKLCGICHQPTESPVGQVMHPPMDGGILCGTAAKRTFAYEGEPVRVPPSPEERILRAQFHLGVLVGALQHHKEQEDVHVEVHGADGWVNVIDLVEPLLADLGVT